MTILGNSRAEDKPTAVVLGGTVAHRHLIDLLQRRGYCVVLVDYLPKPPAADLADLHLQESTLEMETVLKIATDFNAQLVLSPAVDQAHVTAAYCSEMLGLRTPIPFAIGNLLADKQVQKQLMNQSGVPTAKAQIFELPEKNGPFLGQEPSVDFPAVVKPTDSNGSKGVSVVRTYDELLRACVSAASISRKKNILVEELNAGPEFSFYFWVNNFEPRLIYSKIKVRLSESDSSLFAPLSLAHPALSVSQQNQVADISNRIVSATGLSTGPLMIQANLVQGIFKVIEFAPRLGGGLSTLEIERVTGVDLLALYLDRCLNKPECIPLEIPSQQMLSAVLHLYSGSGAVSRVIGLQELVDDSYFEEFHFQRDFSHRKDASGLESRNRILALHGTYSCFADVKIAIEALKSTLVFLGDSERNLLRKDLLNLDWRSVEEFFPAQPRIQTHD